MTTMTTKVFVFRHVETADNTNHVFSGHRDVPITDIGKEQARELATKLAQEKISFAFSSPLQRTIQTLDIVLQEHKEPNICIDPRIIERSYGWLEGQSKDKWAKYAYPLFKIWHRSYRVPPPGGESLKTVRERVLPFVEDIVDVARQFRQNIAVCAHGNSLRAIREYFEGLPEEAFNKMESKVGQLFEYEV